METRQFAEVSVLHLEPETYAKLLELAQTGPGRPGGRGYDPENPWHGLIVELHTYGCWVHTGIVDEAETGGLLASLTAVLREARACNAAYVLFDADLTPLLDLPVFEHPEPEPKPAEPRRVVFQYLVPVHVAVEDGAVTCVTVIDETPVAEPTLVEGDAAYLEEVVAAADERQPWPSWRFGY